MRPPGGCDRTHQLRGGGHPWTGGVRDWTRVRGSQRRHGPSSRWTPLFRRRRASPHGSGHLGVPSTPALPADFVHSPLAPELCTGVAQPRRLFRIATAAREPRSPRTCSLGHTSELRLQGAGLAWRRTRSAPHSACSTATVPEVREGRADQRRGQRAPRGEARPAGRAGSRCRQRAAGGGGSWPRRASAVPRRSPACGRPSTLLHRPPCPRPGSGAPVGPSSLLPDAPRSRTPGHTCPWPRAHLSALVPPPHLPLRPSVASPRPRSTCACSRHRAWAGPRDHAGTGRPGASKVCAAVGLGALAIRVSSGKDGCLEEGASGLGLSRDRAAGSPLGGHLAGAEGHRGKTPSSVREGPAASASPLDTARGPGSTPATAGRAEAPAPRG